jgi:hypothetical protein
MEAGTIGTIFSSAMLAAYGPWGVVFIAMGIMLVTYFRGRDARIASLNDQMQKSIREDQRELWERQAHEIESLRVDIQAFRARLRETEQLVELQRIKMYEQYGDWRDAYHAANNARQALINSGAAKTEDFVPLKIPKPPLLRVVERQGEVT